MHEAVEAGREAFLAGRIPRKAYASASSPTKGSGRVGRFPAEAPSTSSPTTTSRPAGPSSR